MKRLTPVRRRLVATGLGGALVLGLGAATPALAGLAESPSRPRTRIPSPRGAPATTRRVAA